MIVLKEVYEFLRDNGYLMASKDGKYQFTKKWSEDLKNLGTNSVAMHREIALSRERSLELLKTDTEVQQRAFLNYILAAKVPRRLEGSRGDTYDVNKYSEEGFKVFQKCIASGIDISLLVKSTALYYASGTGFKKKIGNYLVDGDWRSDYLELLRAAEEGEESLKSHITEELDNGEHTSTIF